MFGCFWTDHLRDRPLPESRNNTAIIYISCQLFGHHLSQGCTLPFSVSPLVVACLAAAFLAAGACPEGGSQAWA